MLHGKEIYLFFGIYGINGIIGIIIAQFLIGVIVYKTFTIIYKNNIKNYGELIQKINNSTRINEIIKIIINIFLLLSFYVMVAGFGAYFAQEIGIPNIIGTIIIIILCYIVFMGNIESIIKVNTVLVPILIVLIIVLSIKNIDTFSNINEKMIETNIVKSIYSAIVYSSYNSITLIPIIVTLKKHIKNRKQIIKIASLCTIILVLLAIAVYFIILKVDIDINQVELPTVYVASQSGVIYKYLYGLTIVLAIFTSAIGAGYSILENYTQKPKKYRRMAIIMCISAIFVSKIGFSNLVNLLYPVFGLLGTVQIGMLMFHSRNL